MPKLLVPLLLALLIAASGVWAVGEHTWSSQYDLIYYVNGSTGSDSNSGLSATAAWATLGKAEGVVGPAKLAGSNVLLNIAAGTYREDLFDDSAGAVLTGSTSLVIRGNGSVIIKGSDLTAVGDWSLEAGLCAGADCYSHAWTNNWGVQADPWGGTTPPGATDDIVLRREMVFVDDTLYRQYLTSAELEANQSSYWVDEAANKIYVHLPVGTVPGDYTTPGIEVAERETAFQSLNAQNVTLRGLTFQHFANLVQKATVHLVNGTDLLIDDCTASWNSNSGFSSSWGGGPLRPDGITFTDVDSLNNGIHGMGFNGGNNITLTNVESSYHNWRGLWGDYTDWSTSNKFYSTRDVTITDFTATDVQGMALWFDTDNKRVTVDGCTISGAYEQGIFIEANQGPISISNCSVTDSRLQGVQVQNSENVTLDNMNIYDNYTVGTVTQLHVAGVVGGRSVPDRDGGGNDTVFSDGMILTNSTISGTTTWTFLVWLGAEVDRFLNSYSGDYNAYKNDHVDAFSTYGHSPSQETFELWRAATGQDQNSTWTTLP
jgi:hypothetical protein